MPHNKKIPDLRDEIFRDIEEKTAKGLIIADGAGVIAGTDRARREAAHLHLAVNRMMHEGSRVQEGDIVGVVQGKVKDVISADDYLPGCISKASGIASAADRFMREARDGLKIVCGAWKKMPFELKENLRRAVMTGGAAIRISNDPFIYLDKNYTEVFGGVGESLKATRHLKGYLKVVQVKGKFKDIGLEAQEAAVMGADILFIDTGNLNDLKTVIEDIQAAGLRDKVKIAFGGGIRLEDMGRIKTLDVDILDIGKAIIDAPLLDLKYEVKMGP